MYKFLSFVLVFLLSISASAQNNVATETIVNWAFNQNTGGFQVDLQDQTSPPLDLFFTRALGTPTTLSTDAAIDDKTVTVTSATNFTDGAYIGIFSADTDDGRFYFGEQLGAPTGLVITLDTPLDFAFKTGDTAFPLSREMNVNGSVTPVTFSVQGPGVGTIDIVRFMIKMVTDSAVSLAKFGDVTSLTNGLVLRYVSGGTTKNIWNVKNNGEIAHLTYDYAPYTATNPTQGTDGALFRNTYGGTDKHGVVIRLGDGERLELIVQDDLTDLTTFRVMAQGHIVVD